MTHFLKPLLALMLAFPLTAMAQDVINLWPNGAIPNAITGATITEKSETSPDGILRISQVSIPTLTVYRPANQTSDAAIMICPGGGYSILAASHEGADIARWFNELGMTAFVLKYRLPNETIMTLPHEVPLLDAMQGMKLIRQNAVRYGLNPDKLGVMGFSAGGHLAATLSTHYDKGIRADETAKPNFAVLLYPVITFGPKAHSGSRDKLLGKNAPTELVTYYSNELQVTNKTPPTLLVHSIDDTGVPVENSIDYALALKQNKVLVELHLYPTGGHGYGLRTAGKGTVANWPEACKNWLTGLELVK